MKKIVLSEEERNDISKKHEEIDRGIMNFLLRRYSVEEKTLPKGRWSDEDDDLPPLSWTEVSFIDFPEYGFNTYMSRKDIEWKILNMLEEAEKLNVDDFRGNRGFDANRQKTIKTIRAFLNFVLPK